MGVTYIYKEIPNVTTKVKSRYFVVKEVIIIPKPNDKKIITSKSTGVNKIQ